MLEELWNVCARRLQSRDMVVYYYKGPNAKHRVSIMKCMGCNERAQIMYAPLQKQEITDGELADFVGLLGLNDNGDASCC